MAYDYREAMREDIEDFVSLNIEWILGQVEDPEDREAVEEFLNDTLWTEDSVTGNASGSYTFNREQAKEYVIENLYIATQALNEFGMAEKLSSKIENDEWEWLDVTIRCYLLSEIIGEDLDNVMAILN